MFILMFAIIIMSASDFDSRSMPWLGICIGIALWAIADSTTAYLEWNEIESVLSSLAQVVFAGGLLSIGLGAFYRRIVNKELGPDNSARPKSSASAA
jgi:hypothetical protein